MFPGHRPDLKQRLGLSSSDLPLPEACPWAPRAMALRPSEGLSFLLWKGLESKLARARRVLRVAEVGKGREVPLSLWGTRWQRGRGS